MGMPLQPTERESLGEALSAIRSELKANTETTRRIEHLLTGNGAPHKGMIVRMDRLEQSENRRAWWVRTAVGLGVASLAAWIERVTHGGH